MKNGKKQQKEWILTTLVKSWALLHKMAAATPLIHKNLAVIPLQIALHIKNRAEKIPLNTDIRIKVK